MQEGNFLLFILILLLTVLKNLEIFNRIDNWISKRSGWVTESIGGEYVNIPLFFNWDSLHVRLNSHYGEWSYKKKKIKAYKKSVQKELTVKRSLLILDLKPFKS